MMPAFIKIRHEILEIAYENGQTEIMKFPELVSGSCYNIALTEKFAINKKEEISLRLNKKLKKIKLKGDKIIE